MRLRHIIIVFILVMTTVQLHAGPARNSAVFLKQPDGSVFQARIKGDEFTRIKTDISGHAIIQDEDGWWNYAIYEADGSRYSSGWRAGSDAPSEILAASSRIPYDILSEKARMMRHEMKDAELPVYRRIKERRGVQTRSEAESVSMHGLVILANFKDVKFQHTREDFEKLLTEKGYSVNGATGSVKEYFEDQFNGHAEFDFYVTDIVTLPKNRSYYGSNDSNGRDNAPAEMVADACRLADADVDFSLYDDDEDGKVDNVFVFFAGQDEAEGASEECIWSHAWYVQMGAGIELELDGKAIDRYACSAEVTIQPDAAGNTTENIMGIGTFCHEFSHTLGLPDFYDTDYEESGGVAAGLWGGTSLMDSGNYNNMGNTPPSYNAIERMILGISTPEVLEKTGTYTLEPIHVNGASYMVKTDNEEEFFIFECREHSGWDRYIGGTGMLAYRINMYGTTFTDWLARNNVNVDPSCQKVDLIEADGRADSFLSMDDSFKSKADISGIFYPQDESDTINLGSSECVIESIRKEGSGKSIRFNFISPDGTLMPPEAAEITKEVFADAAIINFESSYPYEGEATLLWGRSGTVKDTLQIKPYSIGKYAAILENLESAGKTYEIDIYFADNGLEGDMKSTSIMTKRMPATDWPYIYLGSMERNDDGSFVKGTKAPLRVYGATGAAEIRWEFNGKQISHDGDGYYRLNESGNLKATIYWEDGSVDKVMKYIKIKE